MVRELSLLPDGTSCFASRVVPIKLVGTICRRKVNIECVVVAAMLVRLQCIYKCCWRSEAVEQLVANADGQ